VHLNLTIRSVKSYLVVDAILDGESVPLDDFTSIGTGNMHANHLPHSTEKQNKIIKTKNKIFKIQKKKT
jgi:hypothetical protein